MSASSNITIYVDNKAEDVPRLLVCRMKVNKSSGLLFVMRPDIMKTFVLAMNSDQVLAWYSTDKTDCPTMPTEAVDRDRAIADVQAGAVIAPDLAPIRLKSQWAGKCEFNPTGFVVTLLRKPNNYTMLELESDPARGGWICRVHRATNWHSSSKTHEEFQPFLKDAVAAVEKAALPIVGEACAVKELYRRSALDVEYAQVHPIKPAAVPKTNPATGFWAESVKRATSNIRKAEKDKAGKPAKATEKANEKAKEAAEPKPSSRTPKAAEVASSAPPISRGKSYASSSQSASKVDVVPTDQDIDPAKDKLLMDAFGAAIAQAMGKMN